MVLRRHLAQSDNEEIITDASGDGSVSVALKNPYPNTNYAVLVTPQEADNVGEYEVVSKTVSGFDIAVSGAERKCTEIIDASGNAITLNDNTQEVIDASGNTITFADADPDTIVRTSGDWTDRFAVGDSITISDDGSDVNAGTYEIATVVALTITLIGSDELTAEVNSTDTFTFTIATPTKPDTIIRNSGDWDTIFDVGDVIIVSDNGSDINAGSYTITAISTVTMTLTLATDSLTQEANSTDDFTFVTDNGVVLSWMSNRNPAN